MFRQNFDPFPNKMWVTAVPVATVWTKPESVRDVDRGGTTNPIDIEAWLAGLTREEKLSFCHDNRIQTQTLYGEPVLLSEVKGDFAYVYIPTQASRKDRRGYPGWIPLAQLKQVEKSAWMKPQTAAVIADSAWTETASGKREKKLSFLTLLPVEKVEEKRVEVVTPDGNRFLPKEAVEIFPTAEGIAPGDGEQIAKVMERFLGLGYLWGGMSAFGYDCSGLTYAAHKANGYQIPRDAGDQAEAGRDIPLDRLERGDLLFFAPDRKRENIQHVGIYVGSGKMLHTPMLGGGAEITPLQGTKYEKELCAATRFW